MAPKKAKRKLKTKSIKDFLPSQSKQSSVDTSSIDLTIEKTIKKNTKKSKTKSVPAPAPAPPAATRSLRITRKSKNNTKEKEKEKCNDDDASTEPPLSDHNFNVALPDTLLDDNDDYDDAEFRKDSPLILQPHGMDKPRRQNKDRLKVDSQEQASNDVEVDTSIAQHRLSSITTPQSKKTALPTTSPAPSLPPALDPSPFTKSLSSQLLLVHLNQTYHYLRSLPQLDTLPNSTHLSSRKQHQQQQSLQLQEVEQGRPADPQLLLWLDHRAVLETYLNDLKDVFTSRKLLYHDQSHIRTLNMLCIIQVFRIFVPEPPYSGRVVRIIFQRLLHLFKEAHGWALSSGLDPSKIKAKTNRFSLGDTAKKPPRQKRIENEDQHQDQDQDEQDLQLLNFDTLITLLHQIASMQVISLITDNQETCAEWFQVLYDVAHLLVPETTTVSIEPKQSLPFSNSDSNLSPVDDDEHQQKEDKDDDDNENDESQLGDSFPTRNHQTKTKSVMVMSGKIAQSISKILETILAEVDEISSLLLEAVLEPLTSISYYLPPPISIQDDHPTAARKSTRSLSSPFALKNQKRVGDEIVVWNLEGDQQLSSLATPAFKLAVSVIQSTKEYLQSPVSLYLNTALVSPESEDDFDAVETAENILLHLNRIAPDLLLYVVPNLENKLCQEDSITRKNATSFILSLVFHPKSSVGSQYPHLWKELLRRFQDFDPEIRAMMCQYAPYFWVNPQLQAIKHIVPAEIGIGVVAAAGATRKKTDQQTVPVPTDSEQSADYIETLLIERTLDAEEKVRSIAVSAIMRSAQWISKATLHTVSNRLLDKKPGVRLIALEGMLDLYSKMLKTLFLSPELEKEKQACLQEKLHIQQSNVVQKETEAIDTVPAHQAQNVIEAFDAATAKDQYQHQDQDKEKKQDTRPRRSIRKRKSAEPPPQADDEEGDRDSDHDSHPKKLKGKKILKAIHDESEENHKTEFTAPWNDLMDPQGKYAWIPSFLLRSYSILLGTNLAFASKIESAVIDEIMHPQWNLQNKYEKHAKAILIILRTFNASEQQILMKCLERRAEIRSSLLDYLEHKQQMRALKDKHQKDRKKLENRKRLKILAVYFRDEDPKHHDSQGSYNRALECLEALDQVADFHVFKELEMAIDFSVSISKSKSSMKEVCQRVGSKSALATFLLLDLYPRARPFFVSSEILNFISKEMNRECSEFVDVACWALNMIAEVFPKSFARSDEDLFDRIAQLFNKENTVLWGLKLLSNIGDYLYGIHNEQLQDIIVQQCFSVTSVDRAKWGAKALVKMYGDDSNLPVWKTFRAQAMEGLKNGYRNSLDVFVSSETDSLELVVKSATSSAIALTKVASLCPSLVQKQRDSMYDVCMNFLRKCVFKENTWKEDIMENEEEARISDFVIAAQALLKLTSRCLTLYINDENLQRSRITSNIRDFLQLVLSIVCTSKGDMFNIYDKKDDSEERERELDENCGSLRQIAAASVLRLVRQSIVDDCLTHQDFLDIAQVAQDPLPGVRNFFATKVFQGVRGKKLNFKWIFCLILMAVDPDKENLTMVKKYCIYLINQRRQKVHQKKTSLLKDDKGEKSLLLLHPESILPFVIWMIAHHPDTKVDREEMNFQETRTYISFFFDCLLEGPENYAAFLHQILNSILAHEDATDVDENSDGTEMLRSIASLAISILKKKEEGKKWNLTQLPGTMNLPKSMYRNPSKKSDMVSDKRKALTQMDDSLVQSRVEYASKNVEATAHETTTLDFAAPEVEPRPGLDFIINLDTKQRRDVEAVTPSLHDASSEEHSKEALTEAVLGQKNLDKENIQDTSDEIHPNLAILSSKDSKKVRRKKTAQKKTGKAGKSKQEPSEKKNRSAKTLSLTKKISSSEKKSKLSAKEKSSFNFVLSDTRGARSSKRQGTDSISGGGLGGGLSSAQKKSKATPPLDVFEYGEKEMTPPPEASVKRKLELESPRKVRASTRGKEATQKAEPNTTGSARRSSRSSILSR